MQKKSRVVGLALPSAVPMTRRTRSTKGHMSPPPLPPLPLYSFQPEPTSQLELMQDPAELRV
jgi:hypothetical protein